MTGIYYAFADDLLSYQCDTCARPCCKETGFAAGPEGEALVQLAPAIAYAPRRTEVSGLTRYSTPRNGCWFLEERGCGLHGQPQRPTSCGLFPFDVFGRLDGVLTVTPDPRCPITVGPGVRHADLDATHARFAGSAALFADVALDTTVALETAIRDDLASRDSESFLEDVASMSAITQGGPEAGISQDKLHDRWAAWSTFLGVEQVEHVEPTSSRLMRAFLPALRLDALGARFSVDELPLASAALYFYVRLGDRLWGTPRATYRTLVELANSVGAFLQVLVHLEAVEAALQMTPGFPEPGPERILFLLEQGGARS